MGRKPIPSRAPPPVVTGKPVKPAWLTGRGAELFEEIVGFASWLTIADSHKLANWCDRHAEYEQLDKRATWTASDRSDHRAAASALGLS